MKKLTSIIMIMGVLIMTNAQIEKKEILERLKTELLPQTDDYNPYQYVREKFIISCLETSIENKRNDCESVEKIIEMFYEVDSMGRKNESIEYLKYISRFQCQEAYNFFETQIKTNSSDTVRYYAMMFLAWSLDPVHLPCIFEYAKKDSLSVIEKLALGGAFMIYGVYTPNTELKEKASKFLDEICYDFSSDTIPGFDPSMDIIRSGCDACYFKLGGKTAINFYTSLLEQREGFRKVALAAHRLAPLGAYETTYPIFVEAIQSEIVNDVLEAIDGLKVIGTEEALRLIEKQIQNKNEKIANKAHEVIRNLEKVRREE